MTERRTPKDYPVPDLRPGLMSGPAAGIVVAAARVLRVHADKGPWDGQVTMGMALDDLRAAFAPHLASGGGR